MDGTPTPKPPLSMRASGDAQRALVGDYSVRDVTELLSIPAELVRRCARDELVPMHRDEQGEYRFGYDGVVALRELYALYCEASPRRVHRAMRQLRATRRSGALAARIRLEQGHLVARDAYGAWNPLSGQALLDLSEDDEEDEGRPDASLEPDGGGGGGGGGGEVVAFPEPAQAPRFDESELLTSDDWFRLAYECECEGAMGDALEAYRRSVELDPSHLDAALNLGRLLHEAGRLDEAEAHYRSVLQIRPDDSLAAFNLGVLLEDQRRVDEALCAYELAIQHDPDHADAHYNAARLYQSVGQVHRALWHFQVYRNLTK
jgi:tetratricopeptide (TPR) repeat protein